MLHAGKVSRNAYITLVRETEEKRPFARPTHRRDNTYQNGSLRNRM
jgi:hypothetical protein